MVENLSYEDTSGNRTRVPIRNLEGRPARPPADYRIVGPKGTRIVEN